MNEEIYLRFLRENFECPGNYSFVIDVTEGISDEEWEGFDFMCTHQECLTCWKKYVQYWALNQPPVQFK